MATTLIDVGSLASLTHTRYTIYLSSGKRLVLFRLPKIEASMPQPPGLNESEDGWSYYAMEAECPHSGGPMTEAHVDIEDSAYVASCPWHAYDFNVKTGESSYGIKACTFPVFIKDGRVCLQFPDRDIKLAKVEPVSEKVKFKHGPRTETSKGPVYLDDDATMCDWCVHILNTSDPEHKILLTTHFFSLFATREESSNPMELGAGTISPPEEPAREESSTVAPGAMPKAGKGGTLKSRIAMMHALANIEQWAIDLAIDICVRFATFQTNPSAQQPSRELPRTFYYDWLKVANDEAKHFSLLRSRLEELGSHFGALPVHHGLWESASTTAHDLRSRISIIALVHEARGLDVNPMTIEKFRKAQDMESVDTLTIIHNDEITHVTTGHRWLTWICSQEGTDPVEIFRSNVKKYFWGAVKGPFNEKDREQAGLHKGFYENLDAKEYKTAEIIAGG